MHLFAAVNPVAVEYLPAAQLRHTALDVAAVVLDHVPRAHCLH